jgi:hypothetical protein
MSTAPFRFSAVTRLERHAVTQLVRRAISDAGGWITDFHKFSNFAVVLELEVTAGRLNDLHAAIETTGLVLSPSRSDLPTPRDEKEELRGALRIDFVHDEPDLIIPVPAVPG